MIVDMEFDVIKFGISSRRKSNSSMQNFVSSPLSQTILLIPFPQ